LNARRDNSVTITATRRHLAEKARPPSADGTLFVVTDDKALEAARARVRLLEQTIAELRNQLAARGGTTRNAPPVERPRRNSMRAPAPRAEPSAEVAELNASLEAQRRDLEQRARDLEVRTRERDEARAAERHRASEADALRGERDAAIAMSRQRETDIAVIRAERDDAWTKLRGAEKERDDSRGRVAALESQLEAARAKPVSAPAKPARRNTAEFDAQTTRVQGLERQLEALRGAWKASEEKVLSLEAKLKAMRSVDAVAIIRVAADRAGELARLLEGAAVKLKPE
jgi:DNA repair exonuclease SbcCD ATPase subunit